MTKLDFIMKEISSSALIELSLDLAQSLTNKDRLDRLLSTVRKTITCDSVAILSVDLDSQLLTPLALQGLSRDTLGRRFYLTEHPRFKRICLANKAVRFAAHCDLPDPYDGLLIDRDGDLPVHACMGLPLLFDDKLIGILTLDSLTPNVFDDIPQRTLDVISAMAAANLNAALTIELLEQRAVHSEQVVAELSMQSPQLKIQPMIGKSPAMKKLQQEIALVAPSDFTILINGETGVGKELVARDLHLQSTRKNAAIVHVNCAALPEHLIESELFGHVKGAFTGADKSRAGKFSIADGGTLFLDEIGELPLLAQSKLLRVLQNNEIQAVGQDKIKKVDVRVLAATNRDLAHEVAEGRFRADLYHRLSVYPILVPPLKERAGDIPLLTGFFAERVKRKLGIAQISMNEDFFNCLNDYHWPGNVRELENFINRAALKAMSRQSNSVLVKLTLADCEQLKLAVKPIKNIEVKDKLLEAQIANQHDINLKQTTENFQRQLIKRILQQEQGKWSATAKRLTIDRANLNRLAKRLGIKVTKIVS